jgi:hypothetical protein
VISAAIYKRNLASTMQFVTFPETLMNNTVVPSSGAPATGNTGFKHAFVGSAIHVPHAAAKSIGALHAVDFSCVNAVAAACNTAR